MNYDPRFVNVSSHIFFAFWAQISYILFRVFTPCANILKMNFNPEIL